MKWSTRILIGILIVFFGSLWISNMIFKREYDKLDKSDLYWTYGRILAQPFKHLKINGGNITNIAFEQNANSSVRVLKDWGGYHENRVKAFVKKDTLFVDFLNSSKDMYEKFWMQRMTLVRIFSPELLSVDGFDTKFEMFKMKQKNFKVNMRGRSSFEVESMIPDLDSLDISQKDSSEVVFEMSPEYKSLPLLEDKPKVITTATSSGKVAISTGSNVLSADINPIKSNEAMTVQSVIANVQGRSLLDIGHSQVNSIKLVIADSSGILLSGGALKKIPAL